MADAPAPRIFISYSRADGRELANDLRRRITAEGLDVWLDQTDLEGGKDWLEQIRSVLRETKLDHLLLALTPMAAESQVTQQEWRLALDAGVRVTPVIDAARPPDFSKLPQELARVLIGVE